MISSFYDSYAETDFNGGFHPASGPYERNGKSNVDNKYAR